MFKKDIALIMYIVTAIALLSSCGSYRPPYQRGYDEGYEAGYAAAGGDVAEIPGSDKTETESAGSADTGSEPVTREKSGLSSIISSKKDKEKDEDKKESEEESDDTAASEGEAAADTGTSETVTAEVTKQDTAPETDTSSDEQENAEVLGEESEPAQSGGSTASIPEGRIIAADAVNEALYSHPEVIDGLRQIYPDTMIFGEYVGDSETNLLHRVNGPHFAELTYNTIVVFDGSKSMDDILAEGFFTKCSCCD